MMGNIPVKLIGYAAIGLFAFCIVLFLWSLFLCISRTRRFKYEGKKVTVIMSLCCMFVAAASWVFNIGWLRFIMTLLLVPFIHAAVFLAVNIMAAKFSERSPKLKVCNLLFCLTYLLSYVLYPDTADSGAVYFFFGIVHNPAAASVAQRIAGCALVLHVVLFVVQLVLVAMVKEEKEAEAVETEKSEE